MLTKPKLGLPTLLDEPNVFKMIDTARDLGLQFLEINLNQPEYFPENLDSQARQKIKADSQSKKISLTCHASDDGIGGIFPKIEQAQIASLIDGFRLAQDVGANIFNIHINSGPAFSYPDGRKMSLSEKYPYLFAKTLENCLAILIENLPKDLWLCVENSGNFHLRFIQEVLPRFLESKQVFLNWDVGHSFRGEPFEKEFILKYAKSVRYLHLHDVAQGRDHRVIGEGEMNFAALAAEIKQCRNLEMILIEVKTLKGVKQSLEALAKLRFLVRSFIKT